MLVVQWRPPQVAGRHAQHVGGPGRPVVRPAQEVLQQPPLVLRRAHRAVRVRPVAAHRRLFGLPDTRGIPRRPIRT